MTAPTHPGDRTPLRTSVCALAVTGMLSAVVVLAAVSAAPHSVRTALAWGAGTAAVVLCAAVATAAHALRDARGNRRRLESVTGDIGRLLHQQARTAEQTRQEQQRLIDELADQQSEFAAERARLGEEGAQRLDRLRGEHTRLAEELERARRERAAAASATSNAAARLQALATATLADLRAMEDRHGDEEVLADLLHLDHRTAQAGRLADSVAVLTGARSGRRWARPIAMESVLRGAMGRISGYRRVRVHSVSETAVAGHAAEGVMHALAELLDNAANFSPPSAEVHVYVEEVPAGVIVSVEDSGLVMGEVQLRRAERAVGGDVAEPGGLTGTRLGLAVVGRLARKYGLKVSFRPSARGGTGVLMLIPQDILAGAAASGQTAAGAHLDAGGAAAGGPTPVHESPASPADEGPAGLPQRRRGRTLAEAEQSRSQLRPAEPRHPRDGDDAGTRAARFGSFRRAVRPTAPGRPGTAPAAAAASPHVGEEHSAPDSPAGDIAPDGCARDTVRDSPVGNTAPDSPVRDTAADGPAGGTVPHGRVAGTPRATAPDGDGGTAPGPRGTADGEAEHPCPSHPHAHPETEGDATS
ncbi:ATP-binding protein [Streptomyces sp. NPDC048045]|uniref:sensor histidine kinase n=1 Tax=Streptomyces sp. NPDC048045 TaxID=3154710 RepID=UPI003421B26D